MQTLTYSGGPEAAGVFPVVVFAHANGYPPGSYAQLLRQLARQCRVYTVEHRPLWTQGPVPRQLTWQSYADDLIDTLRREAHGPVWLVGHSMGAVTGILAAQRDPSLFRGLVALDPVLLTFKPWLLSRALVRATRKDVPMAERALRRPHQFDSTEAAFAFYRGKRPFKRMSDEALWDYVRAGHAPDGDGVVHLRYSGAWEACVYRSVPYVFSKLRSLKLPMLGIAGSESDVLTPAALNQWRRSVPQLELNTLTGGHLIPLESSVECADLIARFIYTQ